MANTCISGWCGATEAATSTRGESSEEKKTKKIYIYTIPDFGCIETDPPLRRRERSGLGFASVFSLAGQRQHLYGWARSLSAFVLFLFCFCFVFHVLQTAHSWASGSRCLVGVCCVVVCAGALVLPRASLSNGQRCSTVTSYYLSPVFYQVRTWSGLVGVEMLRGARGCINIYIFFGRADDDEER